MRDISQKKPTFGLDKGQFSNQLDGFTILSRDIDSASGLIQALTIYDNRDMNKKNIISADSGYIRYDNSSQKIVMDLFNGEIIQYQENTVNNVRKIDFEQYRLFTDALDFDLNRSTESEDDRGDRELKIADMRKRIALHKNSEDKTFKRYSIALQKHINQILYINEDSNNSKYSNNVISNKNNAEGEIVKPEPNQKANPELAINKKEKIKYDTLPAENNLNESNFLKNNEITLKPNLNIRRDLNTELSILYNTLYGDSQLINANRAEQKSYLVEIHKKYAIPFACIVFVLIGCPLGVRTRGGNFGISAGISLGFFILYWACLIAGEKLADRGMIAPWFGMWLGNFIVGILGIILTIRVNNENIKLSAAFKQSFIKKK